MTNFKQKTKKKRTTEYGATPLKATVLKKGDRVGIVAPASRPDGPLAVARASSILSNMGFTPVAGKNVLGIHGYLAGNDQSRAWDFNDFINNHSVRGIFCISGGYGSLRILDLIDYDGLKADPKVVFGSDENTSLLLAIHKMTGLVCFHGHNLDNVNTQTVFDDIARAVTTTKVIPPVETVASFPSGFVYAPVNATVEGLTLGGNLSALFSLMGTRYQPVFKNRILLLEEKNERPDVLDRLLVSLDLSGELKKVGALLFGQFDNCGIRGAYSMLSVEELFDRKVQDLKIPSCFSMAFGQTQSCRVVPLGVKTMAQTGRGQIEFLESALAR
ncbi:MAG: LD-carboxypeptidase [Candidatus Obscuribacterales bacterium]|nr:LD-carboxypeptidase [Candidatus Obscuribacterales bacterium]